MQLLQYGRLFRQFGSGSIQFSMKFSSFKAALNAWAVKMTIMNATIASHQADRGCCTTATEETWFVPTSVPCISLDLASMSVADVFSLLTFFHWVLMPAVDIGAKMDCVIFIPWDAYTIGIAHAITSQWLADQLLCHPNILPLHGQITHWNHGLKLLSL